MVVTLLLYTIQLSQIQILFFALLTMSIVILLSFLLYISISKRKVGKKLQEVNQELTEKTTELEAYSEELYASQEELDFNYRELQTNKEKLQTFADYDQNTSVMHHHKFIESLHLLVEDEREIYIIYITVTNLESISFSMGNSVYISIQQIIANKLKILMQSKQHIIGKTKGQDFMIAMKEPFNYVKSVIAELTVFFDSPLYSDYFTVHLTTKMGIACYPSDTNEIERLPKLSTLAVMDIIKNPTKNVSYYTKAIQEAIQSENTLRREIETALATNAFILYYQPKFDITGSVIQGIEALIRWKLEDGSLRYPGTFIDLAESTGQVVDIGFWVIEESCRMIKENQEVLQDIQVAINLSAHHFKNDKIVEVLKNAVEKYQIPYRSLELEITETSLIEDNAKASELLEKLVALGFHIALDDFGTGYSSINYIKDLPIHKIKVDRSFLAKITNEKYQVLLKTIVQLAKDFGFKVTMEGVETQEQLELIKPLNPYEIQGFLFAKPMPLNQVLERILQSRKQH